MIMGCFMAARTGERGDYCVAVGFACLLLVCALPIGAGDGLDERRIYRITYGRVGSVASLGVLALVFHEKAVILLMGMRIRLLSTAVIVLFSGACQAAQSFWLRCWAMAKHCA